MRKKSNQNALQVHNNTIVYVHRDFHVIFLSKFMHGTHFSQLHPLSFQAIALKTPRFHPVRTIPYLER